MVWWLTDGFCSGYFLKCFDQKAIQSIRQVRAGSSGQSTFIYVSRHDTDVTVTLTQRNSNQGNIFKAQIAGASYILQPGSLILVPYSLTVLVERRS